MVSEKAGSVMSAFASNMFSVLDENPLASCGQNGYLDARLRHKALEIPNLLQYSRAPATLTCYRAAYIKWRRWTDNFEEVKPLPAEARYVVLYLNDLAKKGISYQVIVQAVSAIKWAHSLSGLESPTDAVFIREALNSLKRKLAKKTVRKEPVASIHIQQLIDTVLLDDVTDLRNTTLMVLAFFALLRSDELRHIRKEDLSFTDTHLNLSIPRSKCDQLRHGDSVLVARLGGKHCPIALLEVYLQLLESSGICLAGEDYIFRRVITSSAGKRLGDKHIPLTYSNLRDIIKRKLTKLGLNATKFGTHSLRSGGATAAANHAISDRLLQRQGRWAGPFSACRYLADDEANRLSVSRSIGGLLI
jgi:integrase